MNRLQRFIAGLLGIEPPQRPIDPAATIVEALRAAGAIPWDSTPVVHVRREPPPERPGIKPPTAPSDRLWSWQEWSRVMANEVLEGWTPCRFANRQDRESMDFVIGVVREDFGIWSSPFRVCNESIDGTEQEETILFPVTYIPSGLGIAVFEDRSTAVRAAALAQPILRGMAADIDEADWRTRKERLHMVWEFNGIDVHPDRHAHQGAGSFLQIWRMVPAAEQPRPTVNA